VFVVFCYLATNLWRAQETVLTLTRNMAAKDRDIAAKERDRRTAQVVCVCVCVCVCMGVYGCVWVCTGFQLTIIDLLQALLQTSEALLRTSVAAKDKQIEKLTRQLQATQVGAQRLCHVCVCWEA
jgi:hypothetical protein